MHKKELIRKTKKMYKLNPNMDNYEKKRRGFKWNDYKKEIEFFKDHKMNAAYIAIDRHAQGWKKNKVALYWEGDKESKEFTFLEMSELSNKFANVLKKHGVKKGDRIFIFLPRIPELFICFLGIIKTGAIAGTMFSAFGPDAIKDRLSNSGATILITNKELKSRVDKVRKKLPDLKHVIVVDDKPKKGEIDFKKEMEEASEEFKAAHMKPKDPAFMLYTSGTTGKPKGVVHCHMAILHEHLTAKWVLDLHDEDIYWCTADPGWVTGIAYEILGSWSTGVSSLVYEGRFDTEKWYSIIEKRKVTVWYTAPTAVRMLMSSGNEAVKKYDLRSLRHICSVGEPLNPEPIRWSMKVFKLPFHDTFWQTETGGIVIANYPTVPVKPGSMGKPFPGITASIVDDKGKELPVGKAGSLALRPGWPAMMLKIWKRPHKYREYFINNWYITGDKAWRDKDNYFWFIGRSDDVIKTSGERVGPFEVESALIEHPSVVEAGVIGKPDPLRGEIIKAFITLKKGVKPSEKLKEELQNFVKKRLAGHAYPREIEFVDKLPKTRSGKIMRRLLRAKEMGLPLGDTSTLEEF